MTDCNNSAQSSEIEETSHPFKKEIDQSDKNEWISAFYVFPLLKKEKKCIYYVTVFDNNIHENFK